jgi:hypothetical protein
MPNVKKLLPGGWVVIISLLMIVIIILSGLFAAKGWNWLLVILSMVVFIIILGMNINGRFWGIFIDERNKMTLSRFQLVIWTLIVLSAFITIALERVKAGESDPLAIALPWQLWALMGISTASLVGSPLIQNVKTQKKPTDEAIKRAVQLEAQSEANSATPKAKDITKAEEAIQATNIGILDVNKSKEEAVFSDMFKGDEMGNNTSIDMSKVQMFFFTIVAAISYIVLLVNWIATKDPAGLTSFPQLSDGLIAILGISHAGYLTNKTIDHTKTQ